jgi:hypothetical protein
MLDRKHAVAIYTSRAGMAVGPTGPMPDVWDTIIASCSDEVTELTVSTLVAKTTFRAPYPLDMTNGYIRASLTNAPQGSALTVDIKMNGVSVFTTPITIDPGELTSVTAAVPSVLDLVTGIPAATIPDDAEFRVYVTTIGSSYAGTGLKVALSGVKIPI